MDTRKGRKAESERNAGSTGFNHYQCFNGLTYRLFPSTRVRLMERKVDAVMRRSRFGVVQTMRTRNERSQHIERERNSVAAGARSLTSMLQSNVGVTTAMVMISSRLFDWTVQVEARCDHDQCLFGRLRSIVPIEEVFQTHCADHMALLAVITELRRDHG